MNEWTSIVGKWEEMLADLGLRPWQEGLLEKTYAAKDALESSGFAEAGTFIDDEEITQYPYGYNPSWVGHISPEWNPQPHECVHCKRPRHPGPLRQAVAMMLAGHMFDPDYDADTDDSPILCVGSDYEGPPRREGNSAPAPWTIIIGGAGGGGGVSGWTPADLNALKDDSLTIKVNAHSWAEGAEE